MRIGIFGGSFNPPHKMHKNIALNLIKNNYLDKAIYVPTGNKYNKNNLIDSTHRYNMIKLMISDVNNLEVSDYELKNTLTYTYQTLNYFKEKYPNDEIELANIELDSISSTVIREKIRRKEIINYIDEKVLKYIEEYNLYK